VQSNARHAPDVLDQGTTVQRYLQDAGYRTALFGKYLNLWPVVDDPPHFDRWAITSPSHHSSGYYGGTWNVEGTVRTVDRYSTDFIVEQGVRYITEQESSDGQPWFLELAVYAPHLRAVPEPAYADAPVPPFHTNPAILESDRSDKPRYVRRSTPAGIRGILTTRRKELRTLMSVDDLITKVLRTLAATGELDHTLAFFLSDNGFLWGEHGLRAKMHAYDPSIRVPFYMRWPGHVRAGSVDDRFVANIDIAPTILAAAGVPQDAATPMDGRSLLDLTWKRDRILTEYWRLQHADPPTWASLRTRTYHYIQYYRPDGTVAFREYYDLTTDPWELTNLLRDGRAGNDPRLATLEARLAGDRACAGAECP
jgi:arylsulfatase A-like enzyme